MSSSIGGNSANMVDICIDLYRTEHCISRIEECEEEDDLQVYCRKTCGLCNGKCLCNGVVGNNLLSGKSSYILKEKDSLTI